MDELQLSFCHLLGEHDLQLSMRQLEQFERYYALLVEWNERMNLTGITERKQVYIKHFYDSISLSFVLDHFQQIERLADVGSGAGFPSLPLKILFPFLQVTIIDSLNKRIQFLNHVCTELELTNVHCIHGRAEDIARQREHRDRYDLVTARAVARLASLNELCLPFVAPHGLFIAMKGSEVQEELAEADYSMKELKAELINTHAMQLPVEQAQRHLIVMRKTGITPKIYPRKPGVPLKTPLVHK